MDDFQLDRIPAITRRAGALADLGTLAARLGGGRPVLLLADHALPAMAEAAAASLRQAGLVVTLFTDIKSDPTTSQVDAACAVVRVSGVGVVVALGGGSAMDAGKAAAALAADPAPAATYALAGTPLPASFLPSICIPTTAGTGSETTRVAVLTDAMGRKTWLWGDSLKPAAVILDPELTLGLPAHLTAATGLDALVHAIEASTNRNANDASRMFGHAAIRLVARHLPVVLAAPADLAARAGLQWAAALAGVAIDTAGTAIAHCLGHAMASLRPIHHGRAVTIAMQASLGWAQAEDPHGNFAAAAAALGAPDLASGFAALLAASGIATSLEGWHGITAETLAGVAAAPENAPMRNSTARSVDDATLHRLAAAILEDRG
jgi:alcohol dehydrogenase class IV